MIAIIICFLIIVALWYYIICGTGDYSYKKTTCNYTLMPRNVPVNKSYCPYRAILGTWTNGKDSLVVKLSDPNTFLINGVADGGISCSIGSQLKIMTNKNTFVLDGDKLLYNGSVYEIVKK